MAKVSRSQYQTNNAAVTAYGTTSVGGVTRQMHIDRDAELSDSVRFLLDPIVEESTATTITFIDTIGKYYRLQTANAALTGTPSLDFTDAIKGAFSVAKWTGTLPDFSSAPYVLAEDLSYRYDSAGSNWLKFTYIGDGTTNLVLVELLNHYTPAQFQQSKHIPLSDQVSSLSTGLKLTCRWPFKSIIDKINLSLKDAAVGQAVILDVLKNGTTIYTTKVQIDAGDTTSVGSAVTPEFIANANLTEPNDLLEIYITQVGSSGTEGVGLVADFIYRQTL